MIENCRCSCHNRDHRDYCPVCGKEIPAGPDVCGPECEVVFDWVNTNLSFKSMLCDQYKRLHDSLERLRAQRMFKLEDLR